MEGRKSAPQTIKHTNVHVHDCLEQLVETVRSLHQLERHADKEQLLQLLNRKPAVSKPHNDRSRQTPHRRNHIKQIPPIRTETPPSQSEEPDAHVHNVDESQPKEKVVYATTWSVISPKVKVKTKLTSQRVRNILSRVRLSPNGGVSNARDPANMKYSH